MTIIKRSYLFMSDPGIAVNIFTIISEYQEVQLINKQLYRKGQEISSNICRTCLAALDIDVPGPNIAATPESYRK